MSNLPPLLDPLDDTQPNPAIRPTIDPQAAPPAPAPWGVLSLIGAALFTLATLALLLLPPPAAPEMPQIAISPTTLLSITEQTVATEPVAAPTSTDLPAPAVLPTTQGALLEAINAEPLLLTPLPPAPADPARAIAFDPFTIIPERPRSEFTEYKVESGDTLEAIATRYALTQDTLAWCNDRRVIFALRPGDVLQIPPVNGACHLVLGTRNESIASIAQQYQVEVASLINSPYGTLYDRAPEDVLPGGTRLFIPGGTGELITWAPPSETQTDASGAVISYAFAPGQAGSCGAVSPDGGAAWNNPLPNGTWMRGFSIGHSGIDLAAPEGTPIYAANSGPVLFSGFSTWGYGQTVVLAHGPFSTLYGHMSSRAVGCGQFVAVGQVVGAVGSTGNSTGPHLHFEIRYADQPQDPSGTPGIGW